jgi:hypothetical protein
LLLSPEEIIKKHFFFLAVMVVQTCIPSYLEGKGRRIMVQGQTAQAKVSKALSKKQVGHNGTHLLGGRDKRLD